MKLEKISRSTLQNWTKIDLEKSEWEGERNWKFSLEEEVIIQEQFWFNYENDKFKSINAHSKELTNQFGVVIPLIG